MKPAEQWPFWVLVLAIGASVALSLIGAYMAMQPGDPLRRLAGLGLILWSVLVALGYGVALVIKARALRPRADPAQLPDDLLDRRRPVWLTLSDLFLDDDVDDAAQKGIARSLLESGYDWAQLDAIVVTEVAPVLHVNLRMIAGDWGMFDPDWLEESILRHMGQEDFEKQARRQERYQMEMVAEVWAGVERHFHALGGNPRS